VLHAPDDARHRASRSCARPGEPRNRERRCRWARARPSVHISRHGVFSISTPVKAGRTSIVIRAVVTRDGHVLARSARLIAVLPSASVLGSRETASPGKAATPTPVFSPAIPAPEGPRSELKPEEQLNPGQFLLSPGHEYELIMQARKSPERPQLHDPPPTQREPSTRPRRVTHHQGLTTTHRTLYATATVQSTSHAERTNSAASAGRGGSTRSGASACR
jgi:hypothetical protein